MLFVIKWKGQPNSTLSRTQKNAPRQYFIDHVSKVCVNNKILQLQYNYYGVIIGPQHFICCLTQMMSLFMVPMLIVYNV